MTTKLKSGRPRFRPVWPIAICTAALLAACASGGTAFREGERLRAIGDRDAALAQYDEALRAEPTNAEYKLRKLREQEAFARDLVQRGDDARATGRPDDATEAYTHALRVQPGNDRALYGIKAVRQDARHHRLLGEADAALKSGDLESAAATLTTVLGENSSNPQAQEFAAKLAVEQEKALRAREAKAAAASVLKKPVTLQFRDANLRMVFEALSRSTGLNVILDRDVKADLKTTIFVKDATVEDTVDLILLQNQLERRTLNSSTLFVYPATAAKQKEYQDLQVRTFQLSNVEGKYMSSVLKSVLKMKDISVDDRTNTLVVRDTPDAVAVAAKVIAAHDVPEPEVMLEVEVLEVNHDRLQNLGIVPPTAIGVSVPASGATVGTLRSIHAKDLTVLGTLSATANFQLQDTDANLLASPRIRAKNKEKAKILIGDRIPTITNSVTPVATGSPVVTGTVQYQEVGLKLEFEPTIYSDKEVGIKLSLEVSTIANKIQDANGSLAYQIGTRNASTALRLRDGETQVLGGLIQDNDTYTGNKLPGPGNLPVLGQLFGNSNTEKKKSEVILAITPHIIRGPALIDPSLREVYSGTEAQIREKPLKLDPVGEFKAPVPTLTAPPSSSTPAAGPQGTAPAAPLRPTYPTPARLSPPTIQPAPRLPPNRAPAAAQPAANPPPAAAPADSAPATEPPKEGDPPASPQSAADSPPALAAAPAADSAPATVAATSDAAAATVAAPSDTAPPAADAPPPVATADLVWSGPSTVKLGDTFQVDLVATGLPAVSSFPVTVRYDPVVLGFVDAAGGPVAQAAGAQPVYAKVDALRGRAEMTIQVANPAALSADGTLLTLRFAVRTGRATTQVIVAQSDVKAEDGSSRMIPPAPHSLLMRIVP